MEEKQDARLDTPNAEGGNMHSRSILSMCSRIAAVGHVCHHTLFHKSQPRSFDLACRGIGIFCKSTAWCSPGVRQLIKFGQSIKQLSPIAIPILPPISRCISRCMSCCHFSILVKAADMLSHSICDFDLQVLHLIAPPFFDVPELFVDFQPSHPKCVIAFFKHLLRQLCLPGSKSLLKCLGERCYLIIGRHVLGRVFEP